MKPASPETAELINRVRQQLILAQVRIMELEDERDGTVAQLANTEKLLKSAQLLSDQKMEESAHAARVHAELTAQFEHLRHMQHVTNEALNLTRQQLGATTHNTEQLQKKIISLVDQATCLHADLSQLRGELNETRESAENRLTRLNQLEAELNSLKATRTWRWTAWLRAIGRAFSSDKS